MLVQHTFRGHERKNNNPVLGVLIIFAKLSDIFGRKSLLLTALFIFLVFSSACGAAQTMPQLYVADHCPRGLHHIDP